MAGFSTTTTVENRAKSARLYHALFRDGALSLEDAAFEQINDKVASIIRGSLKKMYGIAVLNAWAGSAIPDLIVDISDDLTLWEMRTTNPSETEQFRMLHDDAYELLRRIASEEDPLTLDDVDGTITDDMFAYDEPESVYEDFED